MKWKTIKFPTVLSATKFCVLLLGVTPLSVGCTRYEKRRRDIVWLSALIFSMAQICAISYAVYETPDIHTTAEVVPEVSSVITILVKLLVCRANAASMQALVVELDEYLEQIGQKENEFFQSYLQKSIYVHFCFMISCIATVVFFIVKPAPDHANSLPVLTGYPFSVESTWVWTTLFLHHCYMVWLVGCVANLDVYFLLLLWAAIARFELLAKEFSRVTSVLDLRRCIEKQQLLFDYTNRLLNILRWMALSANSLNIIVVAIGGLFIIREPDLRNAAPFLFFIIDAMVDLFLFTWAAEHLAGCSTNIAYAVYSSEWIGASPEMLRSLQVVMQRSSHPIVIHMDGVLPILNLEFFGKTLTTVFSYITTLRAITAE